MVFKEGLYLCESEGVRVGENKRGKFLMELCVGLHN